MTSTPRHSRRNVPLNFESKTIKSLFDESEDPGAATNDQSFLAKDVDALSTIFEPNQTAKSDTTPRNEDVQNVKNNIAPLTERQKPVTDETDLSSESNGASTSKIHLKTKQQKTMRRRRSIGLKSERSRMRREQRNMAYSRFRHMDDPRKRSLCRRSSRRFSALMEIANEIVVPTDEVDTVDSMPIIPLITVKEPSLDVNHNFEDLLNIKASHHPYVITEMVEETGKDSKTMSSFASVNSNATSNGTMNSTTTSNHRSGIYLNHHKIPQVVRYGSRPRSSQSQCNDSIMPNSITGMISHILVPTSQAYVLACAVVVIAICIYVFWSSVH